MAGEAGSGVSPSSDRPPGTPQAGIQKRAQAVLDLVGCQHVSWLAAVEVQLSCYGGGGGVLVDNGLSAGSQIERSVGWPAKGGAGGTGFGGQSKPLMSVTSDRCRRSLPGPDIAATQAVGDEHGRL